MSGIRRRVLQGSLVAASLLLHLDADGAPSFDCEKARSYVEKTVCGDSELSTLDVSVSEAYQRYVDSPESRQIGIGLKADQRRWLKARNACRDRACIKSGYEDRLTELGSECPTTDCAHFLETPADLELWAAADRGDVSGTRAALAHGAAVNACDAMSYQRPLHVAVTKRNLELTRVLLRAKADPNFSNCPGHTPLGLAVLNDDSDSTLLLLASGANPEFGDGPLDGAASHGYVDMIKILLSHGANVNGQTDTGFPLLSAARNRHVESVRVLLEAGANPNQTSTEATALFEAVGAFIVVPPTADQQRDSLDIVKLLIARGASVNLKTAGQTPLQVAQRLHEASIAELLVASGAER